MRIIFLVLFIPLLCLAEWDDLAEQVIGEGIEARLIEPTYCDGTLMTTKGGEIVAPGLRIQAREMAYTKKFEGGAPICCLEATGQLAVEVESYLFVGEKLEYNFQTRTGRLYDAKVQVGEWFIGAKQIDLLEDGSYTLHDSFLTTSETCTRDWEIQSGLMMLNSCFDLEARQIKLQVMQIPLFWLPSLKLNLRQFKDSPVRYTVRVGGRQGTRVGLTYKIYEWDHFRTFLRLDYRFKRGLGGGVETYFRTDDCRTIFETISYVASDTSISDPDESTRYRFQGLLHHSFAQDRMTIDITYDKLSDQDMPSDYRDRGLELDTAGRTQAILRRYEPNWIGQIITRLRVNQFQTVKQELPTLSSRWRPWSLYPLGIIIDNQCKVSYLDFTYANDQRGVRDFNSPRIDCQHLSYVPLSLGPVTATPEAGGTAIFYGNSPEKEERGLLIGTIGGEIHTELHRIYGCCKHIVEPYARHTSLTCPTIDPDEHYIFDIDDGWYRLNMTRFGIRNFVYTSSLRRLFAADIFFNTFYNTPTIPSTIPKVYAKVTLKPTETLRYTLHTAWDFDHSLIDHFNILAEWTLSDNFAVAAEYRHRDRYDWRKVERDNFILDSFRSQKELLHSPLSDRRDTFLFHCFFRFHPNWILEMASRHGWNRRQERGFNEFEIDLLAHLRSHWNLRLSYQHQEDDKRVACYLTLGPNRPDRILNKDKVPYLDF